MDAMRAGAFIFEVGVEFLALEAWAFDGCFGGVSGREAGGEGRSLDGVVGTAEIFIGASDEFKAGSRGVRPGRGGLAHGLKD